MFKSKKLSKFKMIRHGFFNRFGGVSKGIYKSLNCGLGSKDKIKDVKKNIEKVCLKIGCNRNNLKVKKVVTQRFFLERMGIIKRAQILEKKMTYEEQKYMKETLSRLLEEKQMGSLFKVIFGYKNKNNNFFGFE